MSANNKSKIHKKEVILLLVVFVIIVIVAFVFYGKQRDQGDKVIVRIDNKIYGEYPLNENQNITIDVSEEQHNILVIKDGKADMIDATCPDHLCVNMKEISLEGESIVCLPNKVIVEIESQNAHSDLDAMVQ